MKLLETRKLKGDNGTSTYVFVMGKSEVLILSDVLHYLHRVVPASFFTMPFTSRANAMRVELDKLIANEKMREGRKRPKGWDPEAPNETF